jgi:hypothetical protein
MGYKDGLRHEKIWGTIGLYLTGGITMRRIALAAFASMLVTAAHADTMEHCAASWSAMTPADKANTTYKDYSAMCLKADYKAMPAVESTAAPPAGATAQCKDGSYSMSKTASGRCSSHGGVAKVL